MRTLMSLTTKSKYLAAFLILFILSTIGCSSSGDGSNSSVPTNISVETATYGFSLRELGFTDAYKGSGLGYKDNIHMVSSDFTLPNSFISSAHFKITGASTNGDLTGVFKIFSYENRNLLFSFNVTLIKDPVQNSWRQIIQESGTDKYELLLTLNNTVDIDLGANISALGNSWGNNTFLGEPVISLTKSSDGSLTGSDTSGCNFVGSVATPEPVVNVYKISLESSSCATQGSFTGFAILRLSNDFIGAIASNNHSIGFYFNQ